MARTDEAELAGGDAPSGAGRVAVPPAELARARRAYQGSLAAARAWRAFSPHSRHHDTTFWSLLSALFAAPGLNRTRLVDTIVDGAGVSRSTAERAIRDAEAAGLIVREQAGARTEVRFELSDAMFNHCVAYFRDWMDAEKINRTLGYTTDGGG